MPYFADTRGRVFPTSWLAESPQAGIVFVQSFGEHTGLYERYAAALNARAVSLFAMGQAGHGPTEGVRRHTGPVDAHAEVATAVADFVLTEVAPGASA